MHQPQVGDDILDLPPPVKPLGPHQPVGQAGLQKGLFQQAGLGVGAVHHGAVARLGLLASHQAGDGIHHEGGLGVIVERLVIGYFVARAALGKQVLAAAVRVAVDHCHGGIQDGLLGAVVLLQQDHLCIREILFEALDVAIIRPAPAVDGLVRIPNHEDVVMPGGQMF